MRKNKAFALAAAALVLGLVVGSIGIASAVPAEDPDTGEAMGLGMRMDWAISDAGARMIDVVADLTGLGVDDIEERRQAGETIQDIAESEGLEASDVTDSALEARRALLDERVAEGAISQEDADAMLDRMGERVQTRMESGSGPFGGGNGRRGGGCGGAGYSADCEAAGCGGGACGAYGTSAVEEPVTF